MAYGEIFRREVLSIPTYDCLNVHPSLLPKYRGSSPIQATILNGDQTTGVSIIQMVRKLDAGPITAQEQIDLHGDETGGSLSVVLADLAARVLPDAAARWCDGLIEAEPQNDVDASITRELTKSDGRIDWTKSAVEIERHVRAYSPWPTAWTTLDGRRLVIHAASVSTHSGSGASGSIELEGRSVLVFCGDGVLELLEVQPEGRQKMDAAAWWRGLKSSDPISFEVG